MLILDLTILCHTETKKLSDFITYINLGFFNSMGGVAADGWVVGRNVEGNFPMFILLLGSQDLKTKKKEKL